MFIGLTFNVIHTYVYVHRRLQTKICRALKQYLFAPWIWKDDTIPYILFQEIGFIFIVLNGSTGIFIFIHTILLNEVILSELKIKLGLGNARLELVLLSWSPGILLSSLWYTHRKFQIHLLLFSNISSKRKKKKQYGINNNVICVKLSYSQQCKK